MTGERTVGQAWPITLPGRRVPHPQPFIAVPVRSTRVIMIELRPADGHCALCCIEPTQARAQPLLPRATTEKDQVIRLVLIRDTGPLVALTVTDLDVHRIREAKH